MRKGMPFWQSVLWWAGGGFVGIALVKGFPFGPDEWIRWGLSVVIGSVAPVLIRLLDRTTAPFRLVSEAGVKVGSEA